VLVSSHVLSEVEQTVDRVIILARGRLIRQGRLSELASDRSPEVLVRTPTPDRLAEVLGTIGATLARQPDGGYRVLGADPDAVGHEAWKAHVELHELSPARSDLEQIFLDLTGNGGAEPVATSTGGQR